MTKFPIAIITGTRAEFGIWRPVLAAINASPSLHAQLLVTGMHLLPKFGDTLQDIQSSGQKIAARILMYKGDEPPAASLARAITGFAKSFRALKPNLVFLLGDRLEMLAAANAALAERIPIAHLHGGESAPGIWDEQIRHAITKMAHLHFCSTAAAAKRIRQMGENPAAIHQVGAPALDTIAGFLRYTSPIVTKVRGYRKAGSRAPEAHLLLHPSGGTDAEECQRALLVISMLKNSDLHFQTIGPNNDPGHQGILNAYQKAGINVEMNLSQDHFWHALAYSSLLIGNSSAGIIEAASFGIPVINIGTRQSGRQRNQNVIDVDWNPRQIFDAIHKSIHNPAFRNLAARRKNLYGEGKACPRIVAILEQLASKPISLEKKFRD